MPSVKDYAIAKLATVTGINAKTIAATTLLRVPLGKSMVVDHMVIRVTAFTAGAKATQAKAEFGGTAAWNDCVAEAEYTVAATNVCFRVSAPATVVPIYQAAAYFKIDITVASDATTETWAVDLFGYLL